LTMATVRRRPAAPARYDARREWSPASFKWVTSWWQTSNLGRCIWRARGKYVTLVLLIRQTGGSDMIGSAWTVLLGPGLAAGFAGLGALMELDRRSIPLTRVVGVNTGAFVAALWAGGSDRAL